MNEPNENGVNGGTDDPMTPGGKPKETWYNKYLEKIIGVLITVFLVGVVSWAFSHFATKIENIEKTIAAHHGPQWEKIEKVVAVGNLRTEFLKAKQDYEVKLKTLESQLNQKDEMLKKALGNNSLLIEAMKEWAIQTDNNAKTNREREYEAYAHLTTHAPDDADVALLNTAHIGGTRFNTGDKVVLTNTSSGRRYHLSKPTASA